MGYVAFLVMVGVMVYAFVDCWSSGDDEVRGMPRRAWLLVILIPFVGGIAYLLLGRRRPGHQPHLSRPRVVAPDDDPEFLRQLDQQRRRAAAEERRERKEREKRERQQRKDQQGDHDGGDHTGRPTG